MKNNIIFISYHHSDREKAQTVHSYLSSYYDNIFFDKDLNCLSPGILWSDAIMNQINETTHFLCIVTDQTRNNCNDPSCFFFHELYMAKLKKNECKDFDFRIIPVFVDTAYAIDKLPLPILNNYQWVSFNSDNPETSFLDKLETETLFSQFAKEINQSYIKRIEKKIKQKPVLLWGPSKVGKTTLLQYIKNTRSYQYIPLDKEKSIKPDNSKSTIMYDACEILDELDMLRITTETKNCLFALRTDPLKKENIVAGYESIETEYESIEIENWNIETCKEKVFSGITNADTVTKICGGRPHIVEYFFDNMLLEQKPLGQVVDEAIGEHSSFLDEIYLSYADKKTQMVIQSISRLIGRYKEGRDFVLNQEALKNQRSLLKKNISIIFKNNAILAQLEKDKLIEWTKKQKQVTICFALFFYRVYLKHIRSE